MNFLWETVLFVGKTVIEKSNSYMCLGLFIPSNCYAGAHGEGSPSFKEKMVIAGGAGGGGLLLLVLAMTIIIVVFRFKR